MNSSQGTSSSLYQGIRSVGISLQQRGVKLHLHGPVLQREEARPLRGWHGWRGWRGCHRHGGHGGNGDQHDGHLQHLVWPNHIQRRGRRQWRGLRRRQQVSRRGSSGRSWNLGRRSFGLFFIDRRVLAGHLSSRVTSIGHLFFCSAVAPGIELVAPRCDPGNPVSRGSPVRTEGLPLTIVTPSVELCSRPRNQPLGRCIARHPSQTSH